ncbi:MAG TPA: hypothetical protein VLT86_12955 [Vicinamibacterales bacterium]|nr:hypothetical protein [Vicinamibacterales bacterium]
MTGRRRIIRLVGEFFREVSVLVVVFVPLEALAHGALTWRAITFTVVVSGTTFVFGVWLEVNGR